MTDDELHEEFRRLIPLPPRRYRQCRVMLARQMALREAGADHQEYFTEWQAKLIADAGERIAVSTRYLYRYRLDTAASKWLHSN
jgi:hypothetical protein